MNRMKPDEEAMLRAEVARGYLEIWDTTLPSAATIAQQLSVHPKRAYRICEKWDARGWWNWGTNQIYGWIDTKDAHQQAIDFIHKYGNGEPITLPRKKHESHQN